jgi:peptide methionine sulfoxide reductase msrA/msrB
MRALVAAILVILIATGLIVVVFMSQNSDEMSDSADQPKVIIREEVPEGTVSATFAGGCFWCTEAAFQETEGVTNSISGYAGGEEYNPSYRDVYTETTGHREALRVYYYPDQISYEELLDIYWRSIDPTDPDGQFVDKGFSYTTAIFYENDEQKGAAEKSKKEIEESGRFDKPIVTQILPFSTFYEAEEYHQDFYKKSAERYESYKNASGREEFKDLVWGEIQKSEN